MSTNGPTKIRILLIDDDARFRPVVRLMLEKAGYEVQEAEHGVMGIACYRDRPSALVITDILMPVMEGFETVIELRRLDPNVKIIAYTAADQRLGGYLDTARRLGAVSTLAKPFSQSELLEVVREALEA
jgi:CheY-like chemotaxis protein